MFRTKNYEWTIESEESRLSLVPKLVSSHPNVDAVCLSHFLLKQHRAQYSFPSCFRFNHIYKDCVFVIEIVARIS